MPVGVLIGIWPQKWLKAAASVPHNSRYEQIVGRAMMVLGIWMLLAISYAGKEADSFIALFPFSSRHMSDSQSLLMMVVLIGWMPFALVIKLVQRRRAKRTPDRADSRL